MSYRRCFPNFGSKVLKSGWAFDFLCCTAPPRRPIGSDTEDSSYGGHEFKSQYIYCTTFLSLKSWILGEYHMLYYAVHFWGVISGGKLSCIKQVGLQFMAIYYTFIGLIRITAKVIVNTASGMRVICSLPSSLCHDRTSTIFIHPGEQRVKGSTHTFCLQRENELIPSDDRPCPAFLIQEPTFLLCYYRAFGTTCVK